jgi:hypothetical protein
MFCALGHKPRQVLRGWRCRKATAIPAASRYPPAVSWNLLLPTVGQVPRHGFRGGVAIATSDATLHQYGLRLSAGPDAVD